MLFDATAVAPRADFGTIPNGDYRCTVTACDKKATRAGTGHFLAFELTILDGEFAGRKLWDNMNLWNPSAQAVEIAQQTMSQLCHAVGLLQPKVVSDFIGRAVVVTTRIEKRSKASDELGNAIKKYAPDGGPGSVAAPVAAAPATGAPRWGAARPAA
jgi:hypothetical protein